MTMTTIESKRSRIRANAAGMLARMKPFEEWEREVTPELRKSLAILCGPGTLREQYDAMRTRLTGQAKISEAHANLFIDDGDDD